MPIVKSISYSQDEILSWVIQLYCPNGFDLDPTYSKGVFYKNVPEPQLKFDLNPQREDVRQADCRDLPLNNESINSLVFDPPFIIRKGGKQNSIIQNRFSSMENYKDLYKFYEESLEEFYRILKPKGFLIFKCQDMFNNGKQRWSHIIILQLAEKLGFYAEDLFILLAKSRLMSPNMFNQKHSRKFHSYFWVLKKQCLKSLIP